MSTEGAENREGFKLIVPHDPACFYTEDGSPFVLEDGIEWDRRRNGDRGGSTGFQRFRCNDPKCPAIAIVRLDVLSDWIGRV